MLEQFEDSLRNAVGGCLKLVLSSRLSLSRLAAATGEAKREAADVMCDLILPIPGEAATEGGCEQHAGYGSQGHLPGPFCC